MTDVQNLIQKLDDQKESSAAFKTLYDMSATIVDPLLAAFNSSNVTIRTQVATLLGNSGDARAVDALMKATGDPEQRIRTSAIAALGKFENNTQVADFLRQMARSQAEMNERTGAVFALARAAGKPAAAELWVEMLDDPSPQIVGNAASQLGRLKLPETVEPLMAALNRAGEKNQAFLLIIMALGDLGDTRAFEAIVPYLKSSDPHKRTAAASALGRLGDLRGIEVLEPLLKDKVVAGQEDHGGPSYTVSDTVRSAIEDIRKKHGTTATASPNTTNEKKPRWKFW